MKKPIAGKEKILVQKFGKTVFEQEFELPDGRVEDFLLVNNASVPSIVFPLTVDNTVLAVNQFRYGLNDFILELPGGLPKKGQTLEDVAFHELVEETGYRPERVVRLSEGLAFEPALLRWHYVPFLATGCRKERDLELDPSEVLTVQEFPLNEWIRMVFGGEIKDSKSIAITALALPKLGYHLYKKK